MAENDRIQELFIRGIPVRHVRIFGQLDEPAACDLVSKALVQLDSTHARIHEGIYYSIGFTIPSLANGVSQNCLLKTKDNEIHLRPSAVMGGDARFFIFEGTVVSANGSASTAANRRRESSSTHIVEIFNGATVTDDGDLLDEHLLVGGTGPAQSIGGASELISEWVFKPNTNYLLRLTNISGASQPSNMHLDFYEPGT